MMSSSPFVSAIVPVYNGEGYLAETLENLLDLGFPQLEVILVDDGSTDGSARVAAGFGDKIRYVFQENAGPAAARNRGLQLARGEVIGFLDADDLWTPAIAQVVLPLLLATEEVDIVQGRIQEFQGGGEAMNRLGAPYDYLNLGSALYRRRVFEKVGLFDETMSYCEDYDWYLRAFDLRIRKQRITEITLLYRVHSNGITHGRTWHEIGMARPHKRAAERRRLNPTLVHVPAGFPSLVEYIGRGRAEGGGHGMPHTEPHRQLSRCDDRPIDLTADAILGFMVVRNEAKRLPYCLDYHRRLGISRFFVVDNNSDDASAEWLLAQPDVHLWRATASFGAARCGTDWTESLLRNYGQGHWCLVVDADELLVYPGCETRPLADFCAQLEQSGYQGAMAIMIDMYSDRPLRETHLQAGQSFTEVCSYFDRQVYHDKVEHFYQHDQHPNFFGGVRRRVFGGHEPGQDERFFYCLNKVPLLKYDPSFVLSANLHWTSCRAVAVQAACLLHFKFFADFAAQAVTETQRQEHWGGGVQYARYAETLVQRPDLLLFDLALSVRYENSGQLAALDLLRPLVAETSTH